MNCNSKCRLCKSKGLDDDGTVVAAHIPLDTQSNGSGRSILGHYVGFSEEHREGILVFNPKTRTTTIRRTYKALGLVEEQRLDDIIYVTASDSPATLTPAQAEQTQFIAPPMTPLPTRSTTVASITSAAGAGTPRDSSIPPGGRRLTAPSTSPTHTPPVLKLPSDALTVSFLMRSFAMYRVRILHRSLNQTCHNQLFGTAIIINELALISVLTLSNHSYVTLAAIFATLRRILSSISREFICHPN